MKGNVIPLHHTQPLLVLLMAFVFVKHMLWQLGGNYHRFSGIRSADLQPGPRDEAILLLRDCVFRHEIMKLH